jgi:SPP1 family predicted phage head-tail adaptor
MRAGQLKKRITIQTRSNSVDTVGGQSTLWSDLLTTWASLTPSGGRELVAAQAMHLDQPSTIVMRWQTALSLPLNVAAMRILYGTRIFNIHGYQNMDERNVELTLICTEGMNDG